MPKPGWRSRPGACHGSSDKPGRGPGPLAGGQWPSGQWHQKRYECAVRTAGPVIMCAHRSHLHDPARSRAVHVAICPCQICTALYLPSVHDPLLVAPQRCLQNLVIISKLKELSFDSETTLSVVYPEYASTDRLRIDLSLSQLSRDRCDTGTAGQCLRHVNHPFHYSLEHPSS